MTSSGLTLPREAKPKVRMSSMVNTMMNNTTSVAPKLRASSWRMEDWNNIESKQENINYGL